MLQEYSYLKKEMIILSSQTISLFYLKGYDVPLIFSKLLFLKYEMNEANSNFTFDNIVDVVDVTAFICLIKLVYK